jgi:drug/metabolite transporter (DMT)-like permease
VSLAVAVPFGVASAVAYGAATAVQHDAAYTGTGEADARRLLRLVRNPRWVLSIGGDTLGFLLQVAALATGPVVLVQPLLVLTLPVAIAVGAMLGNGRPRRRDYLGCLAIAAALSVFFLLVGTPHAGRVPRPAELATTGVAAVLAGAALCLAVRGRSPAVRAATYGAVAGGWFGTVSVLIDAAGEQVRHAGVLGLVSQAAGIAALAGIAVLGGLGMALTQVSFQVGALAASVPASLSADPLIAVLIGAVLLAEHVPAGAGYAAAYVLCLAAIVVSAVLLAASPAGGRTSGTIGGDEQSRAGQEAH